jgi:ParB-like chromosome segregation protein Spo0J
MNRDRYSPHFRSQRNSAAAVAADRPTLRVRHRLAKRSVLANKDIHYLSISKLKERAKNPRTHSRRQIKQIARSIERFGFVNPVLLDGNGEIICGHGRVAGARLLGLETVPTITLEHLSEPEIRAYVITDNRLAEKAGWDNQILSIELEGLLDLGFDVELTGFEIPELEFDAVACKAIESHADTLPKLVPDRVITKQGDLWILGEHRLICGDPRRRETFTSLLSQDQAQLVFISPRCEQYSASKACQDGKASRGSTSIQLVNFLEQAFGLLKEHSEPGAIHFVCSDWRHLDEMLEAGRRTYHELKDLVVWAKTVAEKGLFYRSQRTDLCVEV